MSLVRWFSWLWLLFSVVPLVAGATLLRIYLNEGARQAALDFEKQNLSRLVSGDSFGLVSSLNQLASSDRWVCIRAQVDGQVFFDRSQVTGCEERFYRGRVSVSSPKESVRKIEAILVMELPVEVEQATSLMVLAQALAIALAAWTSRRAEMEKGLRQKALSDLAVQVAHDIRSPLAALAVVEPDLEGMPEQSRVLLKSAIGRIQGIAANLLDRNRSGGFGAEHPKISKVGLGVIQSAREGFDCVNLHGVISQIIAEKRMQFRDRQGLRIECSPQLSFSDVFVHVDRAEFERAFSNILNNAVEALELKEGWVRVRVEDARDGSAYVGVVIEDDGKGIPPAVLRKLGRRGFSFGKSEGNGLGVFQAKSAVESVGGRFVIDSELGKGTRIELWLPKATRPTLST